MKRLALLVSLLAISGAAFADSDLGMSIVTDSQTTAVSYPPTPFSDAPAHVSFYRVELQRGNKIVADSTIGVSDGALGVFSVTKNTAYTKAISNTITADGKEKTVVEPGSVESGFTIKLHQYQGDNVRIQATVRDLVALRRQLANADDTSKDAPYIELPEVQVNDMTNAFTLEEGKSIELKGFQKTKELLNIDTLSVKVTHLKDTDVPNSKVASL